MISKKELKEMIKLGYGNLKHIPTICITYLKIISLINEKLLKLTIIKDLNKSEKYLTKNFKKSQKTIAYPYGLMNDDKLPVIKKAGLKYGFSLEEKAINSQLQ